MLLGAHESVAGGLHLAFERAERDGCEAIQIFTTFNTRWAERVVSDEQASLFRSEAAASATPVLAHAHYLINLASPDDELWWRSVDALTAELVRCETLGIEGAVVHPGAHVGAGEARGLARVARALSEVHRRCPGFRARVLLENTAGQGTVLGYRLAHLGRVMEQTHQGYRLAICIDTCHALAAGYDLSPARGYRAAIAEIEQQVGLSAVAAFHLNDSKGALGSRRDRHEHVGEGAVGRAAFARLVNDERFAGLPAVVETPAEPDGSSSFGRNIQALKRLRRTARASGRP